MSRISWDGAGERIYETGVKNGVLYTQNNSGEYPLGVAWNGLISVTENPSGAEPTPMYADDRKYASPMSVEEFEATIEAYTYPEEFEACDGSAALATGVKIGQQTRSTFGMVYKTTVCNDLEDTDYGYKLHLIYGALASPSSKAYQTINDTPEGVAFSWDITTSPVDVTDNKPTASVTIDSTKADSVNLAALELILFGDTGVDPRLPLPDEIATLFGGAAPAAISLSSIVPADDASSVAVDANIVLTFNNEIYSEAVVVTKADGTIVAGAKTWDATNKILTFNPTANMSASTTYLVTIAGVVDIYSQLLAASVKNFATA